MADFKKDSAFMISIKSLPCLYMLPGDADIALSFYPITIQENKTKNRVKQNMREFEVALGRTRKFSYYYLV